MTTAKMKALGITQEGASTRWRATGYLETIGWLEAWGRSLIEADVGVNAVIMRIS
jgi:hypothetical protein